MKKRISSILFPFMAMLLLASNSMTVGFCECLGEYFIAAAADCAPADVADENVGTCCCPAVPVEKESDPCGDCDDEITFELEEFVSPEGRFVVDNEKSDDIFYSCAQPITELRPIPQDEKVLIAPKGSPPPPSALSLSKLCLRQV